MEFICDHDCIIGVCLVILGILVSIGFAKISGNNAFYYHGEDIDNEDEN